MCKFFLLLILNHFYFVFAGIEKKEEKYGG